MQTLLTQIENLYDISNLIDAQKVEKGALSENHIISNSTTKYFLKKYRFTDESRIKEVHEAKNFFAQGGIPVILPIPTKEGQTYFSFEGSFYALFPFVEGKQFERGELTPKAITSMAQMLARIHLIGKTSTLSNTDSFKMMSREAFLTKYDLIQVEIDKITIPTEFDFLAKKCMDLKKKIVTENILTTDDLVLPNDYLIHGDYLDHNLFFNEDDEVIYVFDFEKVMYAPRAYELWRSLMYSEVDKDTYIKAYRKIYPISDDELKKGFALYCLKQSRILWTESEHYLKGNLRVDQFLVSEYERLESLQNG